MHDHQFRGLPEYAGLTQRGAPRAFTLQDLGRFVRVRSWTILLPVMVALGAAFGYVQIAVPIYTAHAQIIIDPRLPQFIPGHNEESLLAWDSAQVESEIAVLQSERIAAAVVTKLDLDKANDFRNVPTFAGRMRSLLLPGPSAPPPETDRFRDALDLIQSGLSVRRAGLSYAIDISFAFPDPMRSMEIANSVAESYIADQIENRSQAARVGGEWLQKRIILLKAQMNSASQAVQVFRAGHNYSIVPPGSGESTADKDAQPLASADKHEDKTLDELEASASTYRRIYESFLQSFTESVQRQSFPVSDARILTPASVPKFRSAPHGMLIYALGMMTGSLVGIALALLQHHLDQTVRSAGEVADASGFEELGTLPRFQSGVLARLRRWVMRMVRPPSSPANRTGRMIGDQLALAGSRRRRKLAPYVFTTAGDSDATFLTALRTVRVLTELHNRQRPLKTIGITAPHHGSGSSTLASHLGTLFADCGTRTLIVDADFGGRHLTKRLGLSGQAGLAEVLHLETDFEKAVISFKGTSLDFLGASAMVGPALGCGVTAEEMDRFLGMVSPAYDLVVVDLPPVLPIGEVVTVAAVLDGMILVVESGTTSAGAIASSARCLERAKARALGFVLSKASL